MAGQQLYSLCVGDSTNQEAGSKAWQVLWFPDFQVQDVSGYFIRTKQGPSSASKFTLYVVK